MVVGNIRQRSKIEEMCWVFGEHCSFPEKNHELQGKQEFPTKSTNAYADMSVYCMIGAS